MRWLLLPVLLAVWPAAAQEQQALTTPPGAAPPAAQGGAYDIVAADRDTAWRINRMTGEVTVCRVDSAASLDRVGARCAPAVQETGPQQSQTAPGGIRRP